MNNAIDNGGTEDILKSFVFGFLSNIQIRLALQQSLKLPYISSFFPYPTLIDYVPFSSLNTTLILCVCVMPQGRERECTDPQRAHPIRNATSRSVVWRQADLTEW